MGAASNPQQNTLHFYLQIVLQTGDFIAYEK